MVLFLFLITPSGTIESTPTNQIHTDWEKRKRNRQCSICYGFTIRLNNFSVAIFLFIWFSMAANYGMPFRLCVHCDIPCFTFLCFVLVKQKNCHYFFPNLCVHKLRQKVHSKVRPTLRGSIMSDEYKVNKINHEREKQKKKQKEKESMNATNRRWNIPKLFHLLFQPFNCTLSLLQLFVSFFHFNANCNVNCCYAHIPLFIRSVNAMKFIFTHTYTHHRQEVFHKRAANNFSM